MPRLRTGTSRPSPRTGRTVQRLWGMSSHVLQSDPMDARSRRFEVYSSACGRCLCGPALRRKDAPDNDLVRAHRAFSRVGTGIFRETGPTGPHKNRKEGVGMAPPDPSPTSGRPDRNERNFSQGRRERRDGNAMGGIGLEELGARPPAGAGNHRFTSLRRYVIPCRNVRG
jgi:hypothetical protein